MSIGLRFAALCSFLTFALTVSVLAFAGSTTSVRDIDHSRREEHRPGPRTVRAVSSPTVDLPDEADTSQAQREWLRAIRQADTTNGFALNVANRLLRSLPPDSVRTHLGIARSAFEHILGAFGEPLSGAEEAIMRRHAAQLALIAPDTISSRLSAFASGERPSEEVTVGPLVRGWLQSQDPVLATERNERVVEHLSRVRRAEEKYPWLGRPSGLDDRGATLVRYGRPARTESVMYEQSPHYTVGHGVQTIRIPSVREAVWASDLNAASFPVENEAWIYSDLDPPRHYLFVRSSKKGHPYLEGTARDLFPVSIRRPPTRSLRPGAMQEWKIHFALYADIYRQLMPADQRYAARYTRLRSYNPISDPPPRIYMGIQMAHNENSNRQIQREQERVPKQQSQILSTHSSMPLAVRTARFLEEDGTSRTEVYWGAHTDSISPSTEWRDGARALGHTPSGDFEVTTSGALRDSSLQALDHRTTLDTISAGEIGNRKRLPTRALVLDGDQGPKELQLEWIQRSVGTDGSEGPISFVTRKKRTLPALSSEPSAIEVSDVVPLRVPQQGRPLPGSVSEARQRVIPYKVVSRERPIALGFQIYRLTFGADDRTRYTVEYDVSTQELREGFFGWLGQTEGARTSTSSTYSGTSRRTTEYILLELSDSFDLPDRAEVEITVRVTDEVSGQTADRSISLTLVQPTTE